MSELLTAHPIANEFPEFEREEYEALKDDIKANGQEIPIELYKGQILDGRNRYRACIELGLDPKLRAYTGDDPMAHALTLNLHRRHLSPFERAALFELIEKKLSTAAAQRVKATQAPPGVKAATPEHRASLSRGGPVNQGPTGKTSEQAAKILGVSKSTIERVTFIKKNKPDLIPDIKDGLITIPQAVDKINAQEGLKRQREVAANQAAKRAAARERAPAEAAADKAEASDKAEWEGLSRVLDVIYNLRRIEPSTAARLVPAAAKARVLRLLTDAATWCESVTKLLTERTST